MSFIDVLLLLWHSGQLPASVRNLVDPWTGDTLIPTSYTSRWRVLDEEVEWLKEAARRNNLPALGFGLCCIIGYVRFRWLYSGLYALDKEASGKRLVTDAERANIAKQMATYDQYGLSQYIRLFVSQTISWPRPEFQISDQMQYLISQGWPCPDFESVASSKCNRYVTDRNFTRDSLLGELLLNGKFAKALVLEQICGHGYTTIKNITAPPEKTNWGRSVMAKLATRVPFLTGATANQVRALDRSVTSYVAPYLGYVDAASFLKLEEIVDNTTILGEEHDGVELTIGGVVYADEDEQLVMANAPLSIILTWAHNAAREAMFTLEDNIEEGRLWRYPVDGDTVGSSLLYGPEFFGTASVAYPRDSKSLRDRLCLYMATAERFVQAPIEPAEYETYAKLDLAERMTNPPEDEVAGSSWIYLWRDKIKYRIEQTIFFGRWRTDELALRAEELADYWREAEGGEYEFWRLYHNDRTLIGMVGSMMMVGDQVTITYGTPTVRPAAVQCDIAFFT